MFRAHAWLLVPWLVASPAAQAQTSLEPVTLQLTYIFQFQFAGYIAAVEHGFYRDEGLEVTISEGVPGRPPDEIVLAGDAQYGSLGSELLLARLEGAPLVALATIFQHSPYALMTLSSSGITRPSDLVGRRVMLELNHRDAEFMAMFANEGIPATRLNLMRNSWNLEDLVDGRTDAVGVYVTDQPITMRLRNVPVTVIQPIRYGIDFYGDTLFTSASEVEDNPDRVAAFRRASLRGWQAAMAAPERLVDAILERWRGTERGLTRERLLAEAAAMRDLIAPELVELGNVNPGRWQRMAETYATLGMAPSNVDLDGFVYDPERDAARARERRWALALWGSTATLLLVVAGIAFTRQRERRRAAAALAAKTSQLEVTLESMDQGIVMFDEHLAVVAYNQRILDLLDLPPDALRAGTRLEDIVRFNTERGEFGPVDVESHVASRVTQAHGEAPRRYQHVRPDGTVLEVRDNPLPSGGLVRTYTDITELQRLAEQLSYQASHDSLTGLVNRREFDARLRRVIESARLDGVTHALCYLDLDQFKVINDTCGHAAGDALLRQLGAYLPERLRRRDTFARLGGDEFGVLMEHCSLERARRVSEKLRAEIEEFRFVWDDQRYKLSVSIGMVPIDGTELDPGEVLRAADAACYVAKDEGRNRVHVHHADDAELSRRHGEMQWVSRINGALEEGRFQLYGQRIEPLDRARRTEEAAKPVFVEVLVRMLGDGGELVAPGAFLPAAERYDLASRIDGWVIDHVFDLLEQRPARAGGRPLCTINLSGGSLGDERVNDLVIRRLDRGNLDPAQICFEITETAAITRLAHARRFMAQVRKRGCRFALDDFGSGLSSFGYLKSMPVDYLKIDGAFVRQIHRNDVDLAMVRSINDIGHNMGMQTIAEFVENEAILDALGKIGVDYVQGFAVHAPTPLDRLVAAPDSHRDSVGGADASTLPR